MRKRILWVVLFAALSAMMAFAQPTPLEVSSHDGETLKAIHGPNGKVLRDGCPVFVLRALNHAPGIPKPGTGVADSEVIIQTTSINVVHEFPGELYFYLTAADNDEYLQPNQVIKGEKFFMRVFDTLDSTYASGTPYADTQFYVAASLPSGISNVHFGEWKRIP